VNERPRFASAGPFALVVAARSAESKDERFTGRARSPGTRRIMARWAGWGAGPAGAGSAGGPSRIFLAAVLAGCVILAGVLLAEGRLAPAGVAATAAAYFALRLFGGLGKGTE
jgi:hypothetical protein